MIETNDTSNPEQSQLFVVFSLGQNYTMNTEITMAGNVLLFISVIVGYDRLRIHRSHIR